MNFKKISADPFKAIINLGLQWNYSDELISKTDVKTVIRNYQKSKMARGDMTLSVSIKKSEIILADQVEPHLEISVINYPKFKFDSRQLKSEVILLAQHLMNKFNQNRLVIEFLDETLMIENTDKIDPRVEKYTE